MYSGKNIVVFGGTGLIGRPLVELLLAKNANIKTCSLDGVGIDGIEHIQKDLTYKAACEEVCRGQDFVFNLAGMKANFTIARYKPAHFFTKVAQMNLNIMEAAFDSKCEHYFYSSSYGVYKYPSKLCKEEDTIDTFPSINDFCPGVAKLCGEFQLQAYDIHYEWKNYSIGRYCAVYGQHDRFGEGSMVIPSIIQKMVDEPFKDIELQGDGSNIREFLFAKDCARATLYMVENKLTGPLNIGSGVGASIYELVHQIKDLTHFKGEIIWKGGESGDQVRLLDVSKLIESGFKNETPLRSGLKQTIEWYKENKDTTSRVDYFKSNDK